MARASTIVGKVSLDRFRVGAYLTNGTDLFEVIGTRGEAQVNPQVSIPIEVLIENAASLVTEWVNMEQMVKYDVVRPTPPAA